MRQGLKALTLIGLGLFLYSRFSSGTLLFYISQRFTWLTLLAALGLILVAMSYPTRAAAEQAAGGHGPRPFWWSSVVLVMLSIALGLAVPPKPLGAAALGNREVSVGGLAAAASPGGALVPAGGGKTILDWLAEFHRQGDPDAAANQEADVIGFVYRDSRFGPDEFMITRFVVSCCVADATAVGLVVRWPQAAAMPGDLWVRVTGRFEPGEFDGRAVPALVADRVTPIDTPELPYLYP